jgi:hypothetical protein
MVLSTDKRLEREKETLLKMVALYCHHHHTSAGDHLCADCQELADYAILRIEHCPFHANKPTCANCPVHCYRPEMRQHIRQVMRFSGPRMLMHHPWLTLLHLIDGLRQPPNK